LTATGAPGHPGDGFDDRRLDALDDAPVAGRAGMDPVSQVLALVHGDAFEGKRDQPIITKAPGVKHLYVFTGCFPVVSASQGISTASQ